MGAHRIAVVDDLRPRLLRGGDDPRQHAPIRHGAFRRRAARVPAPVGRDDRRGNAVQQDGSRVAQGLRPDVQSEICDFDGKLRERRGLLSLQLFGSARLRPDRAGRHLCAGLPADRRSPALRRDAVAAEDPPDRDG
ncbi:NADH-quinone oxidoreductase [Sphingomonas sp. BHC-A]|nr:NADH-quinone oxidoreductase [Sphingomonas sp. BHC-A]